MDAYGVLVIILAATLAAFLILGIIALALFIGLMRKLKHVPEHLSKAAQSVEDVAASVKKTATPLMIVGNLMDRLFNRSK